MPLGERTADAQRVEQLQMHASGRVEGRGDVPLERLEAARRPERRLALLGLQRQPGADRKDLRPEAEQRARAVGDEAPHFVDLAGASRMSTLLMTMTTFLPQPRICSRKARSVSVNGRSAEVTNSTRSERGTNSEVIASCSRMIALVPGVSTMWMSRRIGARRGDDVERVAFDLALRRLAVLQDVDLRRRRRHPFLRDRACRPAR